MPHSSDQGPSQKDKFAEKQMSLALDLDPLIRNWHFRWSHGFRSNKCIQNIEKTPLSMNFQIISEVPGIQIIMKHASEWIPHRWKRCTCSNPICFKQRRKTTRRNLDLVSRMIKTCGCVFALMLPGQTSGWSPGKRGERRWFWSGFKMFFLSFF